MLLVNALVLIYHPKYVVDVSEEFWSMPPPNWADFESNIIP